MDDLISQSAEDETGLVVHVGANLRKLGSSLFLPVGIAAIDPSSFLPCRPRSVACGSDTIPP
jgi:hypothetical protein